jgi:hypothetical protein
MKKKVKHKKHSTWSPGHHPAGIPSRQHGGTGARSQCSPKQCPRYSSTSSRLLHRFQDQRPPAPDTSDNEVAGSARAAAHQHPPLFSDPPATNQRGYQPCTRAGPTHQNRCPLPQATCRDATRFFRLATTWPHPGRGHHFRAGFLSTNALMANRLYLPREKGVADAQQQRVTGGTGRGRRRGRPTRTHEPGGPCSPFLNIRRDCS